MPYYNAKFAAAIALLLTILIPVYWLSQFGVFFEKLMWPSTENTFYWRHIFTVLMHVLVIVTLLNVRASLAHLEATLLKRIIVGFALIIALFSVIWVLFGKVEAAGPDSPLIILGSLLVLMLLSGLVTFSAAIQFHQPKLPASLRMAGLFIALSILLPAITLAVLLPVTPIMLTIGCGFIAVYFYKSTQPVDVV
ncbi:hypothetical protein CWE13_08465 [Aliidiomarina shirensis]|uniref:Uncharacterized protein n=1 Tax=Aliidiomarina shirensis TaxID=1048642 RepID=A0A432WSX1_9GAMM|nr:hypothetical protein [Aliidiomarina shirensis]RUO36870.1 hypothetical protein CWE13_08465 [Aliidiomarina shirensis]